MTEWRSVPGYEGLYEASDDGRIRNVGRRVPCRGTGTRLLKQRVLKPTIDKWGYETVRLWKDGKPRNWTVHQIVMKAFVGPPPTGMLTRHLDGDARHNHLRNLVYGTHSENLQDRVKHGRHFQAEKTHCVNGHPFDEKNTHWRQPGDGRRRCRACNAIAARKYKLRKQEAIG